jgi:dihydroneopterin aldolase
MKIHINDLTFKCIIGILDFERVTKQKVVINLSFEYKFQRNEFIDYSEISKLIKQTMKKKKFLLIEDALIYIETKLYKLYKINHFIITISKPNILQDCLVSVSNK